MDDSKGAFIIFGNARQQQIAVFINTTSQPSLTDLENMNHSRKTFEGEAYMKG